MCFQRPTKTTQMMNLNPRILTLSQALKLSRTASADETIRQATAGKSIYELFQRVECRFTGPDDFSRLTHGERLLWDLAYMNGEVLNGGFHQYLSNSTGETGEDVKGYLEEIGAKQTLKLFQRLSRLFPRSRIPRDQDKRCDLLEKWQTRKGNALLDELAEAFYRQKENLELLIVDYVKKNRDEFVQPSDEIVAKLKRKDRIAKHYCGSPKPQRTVKAVKQPKFSKPDAFEVAKREWDDERKAELKALALAGHETQVVRIYSGLFMCSLKKAKAAVAQMLKSNDR